MTRVIVSRQDFLDKGPVRWERILGTACHAQATDERDVAFAFWGIDDHERLLPEPDYTISVEDVYLWTARGIATPWDIT